jgi:23S rRNA-/tRNA-specific pseudouridylate synthase
MSSTQQTLRLDVPGERLDKVLTEQLPALSRTQIQRLLKEGQILVNGRPPKPICGWTAAKKSPSPCPKQKKQSCCPKPSRWTFATKTTTCW